MQNTSTGARIGILLLILLIVFFAFGCASQPLTVPPDVVDAPSDATKDEDSTSVPNDTDETYRNIAIPKDWSSYTNNIFGFTMSYPDNFVINGDNFTRSKEYGDPLQLVSVSFDLKKTNHDVLSLLVLDPETKENLGQVFAEIFFKADLLRVISRDSVLVGSKNVELVSVQGIETLHPGGGTSSYAGPTEFAIFTHEGREYSVGRYAELVDEKNREVLSKDELLSIVASFEFFDEEFSVADIVPRNAEDIRIQGIDFLGDGAREYVVQYTTRDDIGAFQHRRNQHLYVYDEWQDEQWQQIKKDEGQLDYTAVSTPMRIDGVQVVDINDDGKEELFVQKRFLENSENSRYYVFSFGEGGYNDVPIAKGYLHEDLYLTDEELSNYCTLYLSRAYPEKEGVREEYKVVCRTDSTDSANLMKEERSLRIFQQYSADGFKPQILPL